MGARLLLLAAALLPSSLEAQPAREQPVGVLLAAPEATLLRRGDSLPLAARAGDLLFAGDSLRTGSAAASLLFCPENASLVLAPNSLLVAGDKHPVVRTGRIAQRTATSFCTLPSVPRDASGVYGASLMRASRAVETLPPEARRELEPIDRALQQNPDDPPAHLARAAVLEKHGLRQEAIAEYRKLAGAWPEAVWPRLLIYEMASGAAGGFTNVEVKLPEARGAVRRQRSGTPPPGPSGQTYALVVGISRYLRLPPDKHLRYAHQDAALFEQHLKSPRGGALADRNVMTLTDQAGTTAAIRTYVHTFLRAKATLSDTVILFIAAHGIVDNATREAFIVTYDSDPEDLRATALPMAEIHTLMEEELNHVARVLVYVDVCRAGAIGSLRKNRVNQTVSDMLRVQEDAEVIGLLASGSNELSFESSRFGGGHGAFSYFLLSGLNGEADANHDGMVEVEELIQYVREKVRVATRTRQNPRDEGAFYPDSKLAEQVHSKPGIELKGWTVLAELPRFRAEEEALRAAMPAPRRTEPRIAGAASADGEAFLTAVRNGALLPENPGSAFGPLERLRRQLAPEDLLEFENRLRIGLQDEGQKVLLGYLAGEQTPQRRADFAGGARYFQEALRLDPEVPMLESKELFCRGRALIFDKRYGEASDLLARSLRLDPAAAYSFNALGIAFLERADYRRAILAFQDASRRAPHWAYPLHNMALAHAELGETESAIAAYEQAMRLAPAHFYIPYNLGLLYQRLNRTREAEAAYRRALALSADHPDAYNALGSLRAAEGRRKEAEDFYRKALEKNPNFPAARHNLAALLAERRETSAEAVRLWRENLSSAPDYLPSRLALAETLAKEGQAAEAIQEYREVLRLRPEYVGARLALAELLAQSGNAGEAVAELREALKTRPKNTRIYEQLGDVERQRNRTAQARQAYTQALTLAVDPKTRSRIQQKLKRLPR
jgi:tetratricopeptide (TPR) repeat protein